MLFDFQQAYMHYNCCIVFQVGLIAARRTGRLRGSKQARGKTDDK